MTGRLRRQGRDAVAIIAAVVVVAGVAGRFVELDRHFWFHDEAATSLRISGYTGREFNRFVAERQVTAADVARFQRTSGRGLPATVHSLAVDDPQHPPLFYVLTRVWAFAAGTSITSLRAFAGVLSLLVLVAGGWLTWELFRSVRTVQLAVALLAISPFELLYAREAREYGLWVALVAAASAALLRALRTRSSGAWLAYGVLLAAALYTFPNTALVLLGQAAYVALHERRREVVRPFVAAIVGALVAFLPWVGVMVLERGAFGAGTDWTHESVALTTLLRSWLVVSGLAIADKPGDGASLGAGWALLFAAIAVGEALALVALARRAPRSAWRFLATLLGATAVPLVLADLVGGGVRSTVPRFLAPVYLVLSIAVAFALADLLAARARGARLAAAAAAGVLIVAAGVASFQRSAFASVWWNQDDGLAQTNLAVARALEPARRPLLLVAATPPLLELSHYLRPDTRVRVVTGPVPPLTAAADVFLYGSPADGRVAAALRTLRQRYPGRVRRVRLHLPCCGAGLAAKARLWQVRR